MKYERLTNNLAGICYCNNSVDCKIPCRECWYKKVFDRLVELEDKIEDETLVELPCKIGSVFYYVSPIKKVVEKHVVTGIEICSELRIRTISDCYANGNYVAYFYPSYFGKTLFVSKEEAEAKLKEVKE